MSTHQPASLTEHPSPPFRPNSPHKESPPTHIRRSSTTRIRDAVKGMLFGNAKVHSHAAEEHVDKILQHEQNLRPNKPNAAQETHSPGRTDVHDVRNPSIEAQRMESRNENSFGDDDADWGWPGLGSVSHAKTAALPQQPPAHARHSHAEERLEAASREAIDSAAEESYGYPGVGSWPAAKK